MRFCTLVRGVSDAARDCDGIASDTACTRASGSGSRSGSGRGGEWVATATTAYEGGGRRGGKAAADAYAAPRHATRLAPASSQL